MFTFQESKAMEKLKTLPISKSTCRTDRDNGSPERLEARENAATTEKMECTYTQQIKEDEERTRDVPILSSRRCSSALKQAFEGQQFKRTWHHRECTVKGAWNQGGTKNGQRRLELLSIGFNNQPCNRLIDQVYLSVPP